MNEKVLEQACEERLEERIIALLADEMQITFEKAMDIYCYSRLAERIH